MRRKGSRSFVVVKFNVVVGHVHRSCDAESGVTTCCAVAAVRPCFRCCLAIVIPRSYEVKFNLVVPVSLQFVYTTNALQSASIAYRTAYWIHAQGVATKSIK